LKNEEISQVVATTEFEIPHFVTNDIATCNADALQNPSWFQRRFIVIRHWSLVVSKNTNDE